MGRRGDRMILQYKYIRTRYIRAATRPQQARRTPGKINCSFFPVFFSPCIFFFFFSLRSKYADSLRCGFHTTGATRSSSFPGKTDVGVHPFVLRSAAEHERQRKISAECLHSDPQRLDVPRWEVRPEIRPAPAHLLHHPAITHQNWPGTEDFSRFSPSSLPPPWTSLWFHMTPDWCCTAHPDATTRQCEIRFFSRVKILFKKTNKRSKINWTKPMLVSVFVR